MSGTQIAMREGRGHECCKAAQMVNHADLKEGMMMMMVMVMVMNEAIFELNLQRWL